MITSELTSISNREELVSIIQSQPETAKLMLEFDAKRGGKIFAMLKTHDFAFLELEIPEFISVMTAISADFKARYEAYKRENDMSFDMANMRDNRALLQFMRDYGETAISWFKSKYYNDKLKLIDQIEQVLELAGYSEEVAILAYQCQPSLTDKAITKACYDQLENYINLKAVVEKKQCIVTFELSEIFDDIIKEDAKAAVVKNNIKHAVVMEDYDEQKKLNNSN